MFILKSKTMNEALSFKIRACFLGIMLLVYVVGFSTDFWVTNSDERAGLWNKCTSCDTECICEWYDNDQAWLKVVRAFMSVGLIGFACSYGVILLLLAKCGTDRHGISKGARPTAGIGLGISGALILVGIFIFLANRGYVGGDLNFSFAFCVVAGAFALGCSYCNFCDDCFYSKNFKNDSTMVDNSQRLN